MATPPYVDVAATVMIDEGIRHTSVFYNPYTPMFTVCQDSDQYRIPYLPELITGPRTLIPKKEDLAQLVASLGLAVAVAGGSWVQGLTRNRHGGIVYPELYH